MTVRNLSALVFAAVLLFILPPAAALVWKKLKKQNASWKSLFIGAAGFFVSARVLELSVHLFCIVFDNPVSRFINGNTFAFVLYGIFMAGIFEEAGRYLIIKFFMKKRRTADEMVMYGIGHGGFEVWTVTLLQVISFIAICAVVMTRDFDSARALLKITAENESAALPVLSFISGFNFKTALVFFAERVFCMSSHVALTVIVFMSFCRNQKRWLFLAVAAHAVFDIFPALYQRGEVSMASCEIWIVFWSVSITAFAARLFSACNGNQRKMQ